MTIIGILLSLTALAGTMIYFLRDVEKWGQGNERAKNEQDQNNALQDNIEAIRKAVDARNGVPMDADSVRSDPANRDPP